VKGGPALPQLHHLDAHSPSLIEILKKNVVSKKVKKFNIYASGDVIKFPHRLRGKGCELCNLLFIDKQDLSLRKGEFFILSGSKKALNIKVNLQGIVRGC
jgi:hypothetical protein